MTHGGGTVAGESPDKAEQQESSKESTPGGGRDPRLSVLREPAQSPIQVDQPTAVFKTLAPRTSEDDAPVGERTEERVEESAEEPAAEPETASETASEAGAEGEGDRLRAAVAAWVASGDEEEPSGAASEPETQDDATEADMAAPEAPAPGADDDADATDAVAPRDDASDDASDDAPAAVEADEPDAAATEAGQGDDKPAGESWFAASARKPGAEKPGAEKPGAEKPEAAKQDATGTEGAADTADSADATGTADAVDQPTTMFKAVRPRVVDQPTTALKLPPPPAAPETPQKTPAERTSKFVPLRPDVPGESQAAKAPSAPAAPSAPTPAPAPAPAPAAQAAASSPAPAPASLTEAERTKQQPMPPLPPLDLLAELTNTPPPAPTPLRTTLRRVRIWTPLVVLLLIVFAVVQFVRPLPQPALSLTVAPTFTFEGGELQMPWPSEGQGAAEVEGVGSLGTYGAQKPAPLASVAKTMTAYVILRDHTIKGSETGPEITIDKKAADEAGAKFESTAAVKEGQTYTQKELLQLLMIPSANNVARLLARWDAGSEAAFVEKMNAAAKDLGMTQSTYTDPSGLESTTVSTPLDQLKLAKAVMQYDVFREIVNMPNLVVDGIPGKVENNNNIILEPGVSGIKTGSSTPAGGNLLWAANTVIDGKERRILGIVMGAKDAAVLHEKLQLSIDYSLKLIQQAQRDVTSAAVIRKGQVVGHIDDGLGGLTPVVADKELKAVGWPGLKVDLELTDGGKAVPHSGKAGDVVGQVSIGTGTGKVSAPVSLQSDLVEPGFDKKLTRLG
ncbi:D-alanyl-D-alanine carboxypeptidase family protein [Streptomyces sp. NPDC054975]